VGWPPEGGTAWVAGSARLAESVGVGRRGEGRRREVSGGSCGLRAVATAVHVLVLVLVHVLALSQLNRGPEQRADKGRVSIRVQPEV
jgi:replicative DNA helicase